MKKYVLIAIIFIVVHQSAVSQLSGYGSVSYGQSTNPLYNYQSLSDQLVQTYVEINSDHQLESSALKFQYVGGSMLFLRFTLRNYYEHRIAAGFDTKIFPAPEFNNSDSDVQQDSAGIYLHTDLQIGARHDKKEFREFDNYGFLLNNGLRFAVGNDFVVRITNKAEYRYYQYLLPFQNLSEILSINLDNGAQKQFHYGVFISGGLKYFPSIAYDTSLFEETPSYAIQTGIDSTLVGNGANQHWVYSPYTDTSASDKIVLARPNTKTTYQIAFGGLIQQNWNNLLLGVEIIYRINSHSTLLTLVQNTSTLTLNEDLYNSVFSAHGPELHCVIKYVFPSNVQLLTNIDIEQQIYETPSYDLLSGDVVKNNREDIYANLEIYVSKYFQVTDEFGFDISLGSNYLRNKSDDAYNDYSVLGYNLSVGIGL